jgi:PIN domain nuclease of toxin-antitoxin system
VRLLLDTHIWLWSLLDPGRLTERVTAELQDPSNELWLSPISTWELLTLVAKGRVLLNVEPTTWIRSVFRTVPFREAPLTHEVAVRSRQMDLPHRDPVDAFLAATASVYELTLVTADDRLLGSKKYAVLPNR